MTAEVESDKLFRLSPKPNLTKLGGNLPGWILQVKFEDDLVRSKFKVTGAKNRKT